MGEFLVAPAIIPIALLCCCDCLFDINFPQAFARRADDPFADGGSVDLKDSGHERRGGGDEGLLCSQRFLDGEGSFLQRIAGFQQQAGERRRG